MSFKDCIDAAAKAGTITGDRAEQAKQAYDRQLKSARARGQSERIAAEEAAQRASEAITRTTEEVRWARRRLIEAQHAAITRFDETGLEPHQTLKTFADMDPRAMGFDNLVVREDVNTGILHAAISEFIRKYRPRLAGTVRPVEDLDSIVREMFMPGSSKNVEASALARGLADTIELTRTLMNRAGASIPKNDRYILPQMHDRLAVHAAGKELWVSQHMDWLDWDQMRHGDGSEILENEREEVLSYVYDTLSSDGALTKAPGQFDNANLASRLSRRRFLYYKDADSWLAANELYGLGNVHQQMLAFVNESARQLAMLEVLGPNPAATVRLVKNYARQKGAELDRDLKSPKYQRKAEKAGETFDDMLAHFNHETAAMQGDVAGNVLATVRNVQTAAKLGGTTPLAAATDFMTATHRAWFNKLPSTRFMQEYIKIATSAGYRDAVARSGVILDNATTMALGHHRLMGELTGSEWSRRVTDTVLRANLLSPHTEAAKHSVSMGFMGEFADSRNVEFDDLPWKQLLERHKITAEDWEVLRSTSLHEIQGAKFLRPMDLRKRSDIASERAAEVADRFTNMIETERRFFVREGSLEGRSFLTSRSRSGTFAGEILRSLALWKNFAATFMLMGMRETMANGTGLGRIGYAGSLLTMTTLAGAGAYQFQHVAAGRDPMDMTLPEFWGNAFLKGGGLGLVGDFLFGSLNRYGYGIEQQVAGAPVTFFGDLINLTVGNAVQAAQGEDMNAGRELIRFLGGNTPGLNIWYLRAVVRRSMLDQLQYAVDPKAARYFRQQERRQRRIYGQKSWWTPGEALPQRAPDIGAAFGQ